jgi:MFS family permease
MGDGAEADAGRPRDGFGWGVVALLAAAVFINYVDRGALATAAPLIKDALRLDAAQVGVLIAAFFWTYTPCQLLAGWLIERIDAYRTLALGVALWSLATALTGLVGGFVALIGLRLLLGLGESAAFPAASTLLARHMPQDRLGRANGLIGLGLSLGPAFGTFAGGLLMARIGWRPVFLAFGLASLVWLWPWLVRTRRLAAISAASPPGKGPAYLTILGRREAWGTYLGHFSANYATYFVLSWMPLYLVKAQGYPVAAMAETGGLIYLVYAVSNALAGWLTDARIRAGASVNAVRKTAAAACHVTIAAGLTMGAVGDATTAVAGLFVAAVGMGLNSAGIFAIGQTLAGPWAAPKWIGAQNLAGNVAGMIGPVITGWIVDRTGAFTWAFVLSAVIALAGAIGWTVVIRKVAPLDWPTGGGIRRPCPPSAASI